MASVDVRPGVLKIARAVKNGINVFKQEIGHYWEPGEPSGSACQQPPIVPEIDPVRDSPQIAQIPLSARWPWGIS